MNLPLVFESITHTAPGTMDSWQTKSGLYHSQIAIPPEFSGPGGALSPEDLFNHAMVNCFIATFKVLASNSKLDFESLLARSELLVDYDENKRPIMKKWILYLTIVKPSDGERATRLADRAAKTGFILNSVKTERVVEILLQNTS
jgi:organic hydroperoxide reductase OsmC/OhrA